MKYLLDPASVQGTKITSATAGLSQDGVGWEVNLDFTPTAPRSPRSPHARAAQCGGRGPQNPFAIMLDGLVQSAPRFNEPIIGGSAVITGSFTADEAKTLANVLKYGSLPVSLEVSSVEQVSPTLGEDQLRPASSPVRSACCSWSSISWPTTGRSAWSRSPRCSSRLR